MYDKYIRLPFPEYQEYMEKHSNEWAEETVAIGDSDVLVPEEWVNSLVYIQKEEGKTGTVECQRCGSSKHNSNDCPRMWEL